jgi:hypothetical protein
MRSMSSLGMTQGLEISLTVKENCDTIGPVRGRVGGLLGEKQGVALKTSVTRKLIRNFALELVVYAILVVGYFFLILRFLADPLMKLFRDNLVLYAFVALGLVVAQSVLLEVVTSFIMRQTGLDQLE